MSWQVFFFFVFFVVAVCMHRHVLLSFFLVRQRPARASGLTPVVKSGVSSAMSPVLASPARRRSALFATRIDVPQRSHRSLVRMIRRTVAESQWEAGAENGTARTISVNGVRALPRTPRAGHTNAAEAFPSPRLSWVQRTREVEKSVFGQVTRHLANRYGHCSSTRPRGGGGH